MNRIRASATVVLVLAVLGRPASAEILISSERGMRPDPLVDANPLLLSPGQTAFSAVWAVVNPFNFPQHAGPADLQVTCCKDLFGGAPIAAPGVHLQVVAEPCSPVVLSRATVGRSGYAGPLYDPAPSSGGVTLSLSPCPASSGATVQVAPGAPGIAYLRATADGSAPPGTYVATLSSSAAVGVSTQDVTVHVLGAWPADGPAPTCAGPVAAIPLGSITPTPFAWKQSHLPATSYALAAAFAGGAAGLQMTFTSPATTGPLPRNVALVTFTNTAGRPVAMRTARSGDCAGASQSVVVRAGETRGFSFSTANTSTLVFSKSTCRAWVDWGDCWGGSALGLDDLVQLSEGPFWTLFGGRSVHVETVGDWGALPRANSVAVIQTP